MTSKVAVMRFDTDCTESLRQALKMIGGIDSLNSAKRNVAIKVGVFSPKEQFHTSVSMVDAIIRNFTKAPKIFIAESDNYKGTGTERLQIWKELFTEKTVPFNLSQDTDTTLVDVADEKIGLSHILFKPNVFVSTHILRAYENGSILKNLLGLVPDSKKMRFHKKLAPALADMYEAIGGIDLAVMDGTYFWHGIGKTPVPMNTLLVGRDAVAIETVGATLAGLDPQKMPITQEFVKRSLGEGSIENIETVGVSLESLKEEFTAKAKIYKKKHARLKGPQTLGGHIHNTFENLIKEGFFKLPNKRTIEEVTKALKDKAIPINDKEDKIAGFLARRVKNGTLKTEKTKAGRVYWTE